MQTFAIQPKVWPRRKQQSWAPLNVRYAQGTKNIFRRRRYIRFNSVVRILAVWTERNNLQASTSGKGMGSQKEINLRDELDLRDRTDIYRNFLHYCMSGNVVSLPMGTTGVQWACQNTKQLSVAAGEIEKLKTKHRLDYRIHVLLCEGNFDILVITSCWNS